MCARISERMAVTELLIARRIYDCYQRVDDESGYPLFYLKNSAEGGKEEDCNAFTI